MRFALVACALAAGCYSPTFGDCELTCRGGVCPSGFECVGAVCRPLGASGPCGATGDATNADGTTGDATVARWGLAAEVLTAPNYSVRSPTLTGDLLVMYMAGQDNIVTASRLQPTGMFSNLTVVPALASAEVEAGPSVSPDHSQLFFVRNSGSGRDIHLATRDAATNAFTSGAHVVDLDDGGNTADPHVTPDGLACVYDNDRAVPQTLYLATRPSPTMPWTDSIALDQLADRAFAKSPALSADKLTLYYSKIVGGQTDIFEAHRPNAASMFTTAAPVSGGVNTPADEDDPWISPDGRTFVFVRRGVGAGQLYRVFEAKRL